MFFPFILLEKRLGSCLCVPVYLVQNPNFFLQIPLDGSPYQPGQAKLRLGSNKKTPLESNIFLFPICRCVRPQIASVLHVFSSAEEPNLLAHPALTYCCAASCCDLLDQQLPKFNRGSRTTQKPNLGLTYTYGTPGHFQM